MTGLELRITSQRGDFKLTLQQTLPGSGITGIFGPSGSGKTSLLRALSGLDRASGYIAINDHCWLDSARALCLPTHRRRIGYVFQDSALFTHLDVRGNLEYGWRRTATNARRLQPPQVIEWLALQPLLARSVQQLSGGEAQRVAIARALLSSPELLLLDEPLAALDDLAKRDILPYLERLHHELALPILYVSHALDEVMRLADHLLLLEAGQVRAAGEVNSLLTRLDLPLSHSELAAAIVEARVESIDETFGISYLASDAGPISLATSGLTLDRPYRLRIAARDVALALRAPGRTSILNCLPARISEISEQGAAQMLIQLQAGSATLLARITRKSCAQLELRPGMAVFALIKSVALAD